MRTAISLSSKQNLKEQKVGFVTTIGQTNLADDWRSQRQDRDGVINIQTNQLIAVRSQIRKPMAISL